MRSKGTGVNRSLHRLFDTLAGRGATVYTGKNLMFGYSNLYKIWYCIVINIWHQAECGVQVVYITVINVFVQ